MVLSLVIVIVVYSPAARAQSPSGDETQRRTPSPRGVSVSFASGYPELHVDGLPFFVHAATFPYPNLPRELWETSLDAYRELGINTIDLSIPWNLHEPSPGELDLTGHTNPRRDLRTLLRLIAERGFKLIARPGPVLGESWRNGGYPEWLLARPEYKMDPLDRIAGVLPPLTRLAATNPEAAAAGWLANSAHMNATRRWLAAVSDELAPYASHRTVQLLRPSNHVAERTPSTTSGPLLAVYLDAPLNYGFQTCRDDSQPSLARYFSELQSMVSTESLGVLVLLTSSKPGSMCASSPAMAIASEWFLRPEAPPTRGEIPALRLSDSDVFSLIRLSAFFSTQASFPLFLSGFQAGWHAPEDDTRPQESFPENSILATHLLLGRSLAGITWSPLQDSLAPAGTGLPTFNRHVRWDSALDLNAAPGIRARAVERVAQLLPLWGQFLASSHVRADFAIVSTPMPGADVNTPLDVAHELSVARIERLALLSGLSASLVNLASSSADSLERFRLLLLPVADGASTLPDSAQTALVEYVRRGGVLAVFPQRPAGEILASLFAAPPTPASKSFPQDSIEGQSFGSGRVLFSSKDFYSWLTLDESLPISRGRFEADWAMQTLRTFLTAANIRPAVKPASDSQAPAQLLFTQRISNSAPASAGGAKHVPVSPGHALLSVVNLADDPVEQELAVLSPVAAQKSAAMTSDDYITLPIRISPRQALLLPLGFSLCSAAKPSSPCDDELVAAGAELLRVERDKNVLELLFFVPGRSTVVLHLADRPSRIELGTDYNLDGQWDIPSRIFRFDLPRGTSPDFLRLVRIHLRYRPQVPEKPKPPKPDEGDDDKLIYTVSNALQFPAGENTWLRSDPPVIPLTDERGGEVLVETTNVGTFFRSLDVNVRGPLRGSEGVLVLGSDSRTLNVKIRPAPGTDLNAPVTSLLFGDMDVKAGRARDATRIGFLPAVGERVASYSFDFDRDGFDEWVLESSRLRIFLSPQMGGRAVGIVESMLGMNLITHLGALRDSMSYVSSTTSFPDFTPIFSLPYQPESLTVDGKPTIRLAFTTPEFSPVSAKVEKLLYFDKPETLVADYSIVAQSPLSSSPAPSFLLKINNSVPAYRRDDSGTQFCFPTPADQGAPPPTGPDFTCHLFEPNGLPLSTPEGITRLEIRAPGTFTLAIEWTTGTLTVTPRSFSAILTLSFPISPSDPNRNQVRFSVLPVQ